MAPFAVRRDRLRSSLLLLSVPLIAAVPRTIAAQAAHATVAPPSSVPDPHATPEEWSEQWISSEDRFDAERARELKLADQTIAQGPYRDDWLSLQKHTTPDWFRDAKFGIFLHWGLFSVPAFGNEWYSRNMYQQGTPEFAHHVATYGPQWKFGYKDFIPMFRMEHYDPDAWASLFQRAGARYVIPVAEHHDGFALYRTQLSAWNAVAMGPHRDVLGDLGTAVRSHGLHFGLSYHRAEHTWFFDGGRKFDSDVNDPRYASFYGPAELRVLASRDDTNLDRDYTYAPEAFRRDWLARTVELVESYHPDLVYFDWWVGQPDFRAFGERFAAFFYDYAAQHHQPVVMFSKINAMAPGAGTQDVERGGMSGIQALPWQTDTSISNASWGYLTHDTFKSPQVLLDQLVDIVSKNGNLLLNVGPKPDGTIPEEASAILLEMGKWLNINGEAIYGSRPWKQFGEGPTEPATGSFADKAAPNYTAQDFRFTTREGNVYAIEMRWPEDHSTVIKALAEGSGTVQQVDLLGSTDKVRWSQQADGLHVTLPAQQPGAFQPVFRIRLQ